MKITTTTLSCLLLLSFAACDKKEEPKTAAKENAKPADTKPTDAKTPEAAKPEPEPEPAKPEVKAPEMVPLEIADWGIKLSAPKDAKLAEMEAGDADMEMPDSTRLGTEAACGYDTSLTRHWSKSLDAMYENSKKGTDGLTDVEYIKDEKTDHSYTIHYKGKAPLGDMYGASTGLVVGDRLVLCDDAGMGRLEEHEAACVMAVCSSITASAAG